MSRSRKTNDRRRASAYSLLELTIVLAIIASLMAIAWPRVTPMMTRGSMREAGRQVKAELATARQSAIQSGQIWEFRILPGTGNYTVWSSPAVAHSRQRTDSRLGNAAQGTSTESSFPNDREGENAAPELLQLPDGLVFSLTPPRYSAQNASGEGFEQLSSNSANSSASDGMLPDSEFDELVGMSSFEQFSVVTRFFPDGRSANRTLYILEPETGHQLAVHVRGLTGGVLIGEVERSVERTGAGGSMGQTMSDETATEMGNNSSGDDEKFTVRGRSAR